MICQEILPPADQVTAISPEVPLSPFIRILLSSVQSFKLYIPV